MLVLLRQILPVLMNLIGDLHIHQWLPNFSIVCHQTLWAGSGDASPFAINPPNLNQFITGGPAPS